MILIATFYSHFGAIRFKRECTKQGIFAEAMPVPRNLSSSCGTCVRFETDQLPAFAINQEVEQVAEVTDTGYIFHYHAEQF